MLISDLKLFQCPYCDQPFSVALVLKTEGTDLQYGTVVCSCDEFPLLGGILFLKREYAKFFVKLLQDKRASTALLLALSPRLRRLSSLPGIDTLAAVIANRKSWRKLGKEKIHLFLKLIDGAVADYHFLRHQEKDSWFLLMPLFFQQRPTLWLDIGSGAFNSYEDILSSSPRAKIISVEQVFLYVFLDSVFNDERVIRVCCDATNGTILRKKPMVITLIDSLPFLPQQNRLLHSLQQILARGGVMVATAIPEHIYLHDNNYVFPLSRKLISTFFKKLPHFFDDNKLAKEFQSLKPQLDNCRINTEQKVFRYSLIWPAQRARFSPILPREKMKMAKKFWSSERIKWKNRVY